VKYLKTYENLFQPYIDIDKIDKMFREEGFFDYYKGRFIGGKAINFILEDFDKEKYWLLFYHPRKPGDDSSSYSRLITSDDKDNNIERWVDPKWKYWKPILRGSRLYEFIQREFPWIQEAYLNQHDIITRYNKEEMEFY